MFLPVKAGRDHSCARRAKEFFHEEKQHFYGGNVGGFAGIRIGIGGV
jgi:hypothetical protein